MDAWLQLLSALGYGVASAWVPLFNGEVFLAAATLGRIAPPPLLVASLSTGMALGKGAMFGAVRAGKRLPFVEKFTRRRRPAPEPGTWRARAARWTARGLALVEHRRWGPVVVAASSAVGVPPLYATTLVAGTTRMSLVWFTLACWVGLGVRYGLLAAAVLGLVTLPWGP